MLILLIAAAFGQGYEAQPCQASDTLAAEVSGKELSRMVPMGPDYALAVASDQLAPSKSKQPPKPDPSLDDDDLYAEQQKAWDKWTCSYGASQLVDGDTNTAWADGIDGPGIGSVIVVKIPGDDLEIRAGYAKSQDLYTQNARPQRVEVTLLGQGWQPAVQGTMYAAMPVLGRHEVELKDDNAWQQLVLPTWKPVEGYNPARRETSPLEAQKPTFVAIRVLSAYEGSKWQDLCISEIRERK